MPKLEIYNQQWINNNGIVYWINVFSNKSKRRFNEFNTI